MGEVDDEQLNFSGIEDPAESNESESNYGILYSWMVT